MGHLGASSCQLVLGFPPLPGHFAHDQEVGKDIEHYIAYIVYKKKGHIEIYPPQHTLAGVKTAVTKTSIKPYTTHISICILFHTCHSF